MNFYIFTKLDIRGDRQKFHSFLLSRIAQSAWRIALIKF
jgi:hypothetical protein